jgi:hypothetical protein
MAGRLSAAWVLSICMLLLCPPASQAQSPSKPDMQVVFGANVGVALPATDALTDIYTETNGSNRNELRAEYPLSSAVLLDFSGGVIIGPGLFVGAGFTRSGSSAPGTVTLTLDHPAYHPVLTASTETGPLEHAESDVHLQFGYRVPMRGPLSVIAFVGPTHFSVSQPMIDDWYADEIYVRDSRTYQAIVSDPETAETRAGGWGYNLGTDVSFALSRNIGIGGMARYTRGSIEFDQPLQSNIKDRTITHIFDAGGLQLSGGIRFRF